MNFSVIMTGFGGQGIQMISQIMAESSIAKGLNVTYLPSYGVEKRGGRTNVTLIISDEEIGSPITNTPDSIIAMDDIGLQFFQEQLISSGLLIVNTDLITGENIKRKDVKIIEVKCNTRATDIGNPKLANMVIFGALLGSISFLDYNDIEKMIPQVIPEHHSHTIPDNLKAVKTGMKISAK